MSDKEKKSEETNLQAMTDDLFKLAEKPNAHNLLARLKSETEEKMKAEPTVQESKSTSGS